MPASQEQLKANRRLAWVLALVAAGFAGLFVLQYVVAR